MKKVVVFGSPESRNEFLNALKIVEPSLKSNMTSINTIGTGFAVLPGTKREEIQLVFVSNRETYMNMLPIYTKGADAFLTLDDQKILPEKINEFLGNVVKEGKKPIFSQHDYENTSEIVAVFRKLSEKRSEVSYEKAKLMTDEHLDPVAKSTARFFTTEEYNILKAQMDPHKKKADYVGPQDWQVKTLKDPLKLKF